MTNSTMLPANVTADAIAGRPMGIFVGLIRALGPARIVAMGVVALATLGFFAFLILKATEPDYTILFGDLDPATAGQIIDRLGAMNAPHRLSSDGRAILVPEPMVARLRMDLAQNGLPAVGPAGYELLDNSNAFTSTDLLTNLNLRRALEGELARTIGALHGVASARVHLVLPKRELFERDQQHSSASVFLRLKDVAALEPRQIQGIRQLVASAVPGLSAERITIVDDRGNLLARAREEGAADIDGSELETQRAAFESRLQQKVLNLLEPAIGHGHVEVEVYADMDFDDETTTSESFDPDKSVPRSTQTSEDHSERSDNETRPATTVTNNLPTEQTPTDDGPKSTEKTSRTEETTNFEVSKTVVSHVKRGPQVRRLTVAVQVAERQSAGSDGKPVFQTRDAAELAQLASLVKTATGFDAQRGDVVEIVSRRFASDDAALPDMPPPDWLDGINVGRLAEIAAIGGVALLLIFLGLRPMTRELARAIRPQLAAQAMSIQAADAQRPALLVDDSAAREPIQLVELAPPVGETEKLEAPTEAMIELPQIAGPVRSDLINGTNELIRERPDETIRVLRGWLGDQS
jgi:flagellar M-ring protein FliF